MRVRDEVFEDRLLKKALSPKRYESQCEKCEFSSFSGERGSGKCNRKKIKHPSVKEPLVSGFEMCAS